MKFPGRLLPLPSRRRSRWARPSASHHRPTSMVPFTRIQTERVFPDGKTFVDAVPRQSPQDIMADYERERPGDTKALRAFVLRHFSVPGVNDHDAADLRDHVRALWPTLVRQPVTAKPGGSALPMPAPYVVPGGRFREMYYWDSYFTMLGLAVDGQQPLVETMLVDFVATVETHGHIPNGMRTYYLSRSQPPFFALMPDLVEGRHTGTRRPPPAALRREPMTLA